MKKNYCDECLEVAYDNVGGDYMLQVQILSSMGDMIEDHICESRDKVDTSCNCLCNTGNI